MNGQPAPDPVLVLCDGKLVWAQNIVFLDLLGEDVVQFTTEGRQRLRTTREWASMVEHARGLGVFFV